MKRLLAILLLAALPALVPVQAKRVALVVGNATYPAPASANDGRWGALPNPVNDARAVGQAVRGFGFEVVVAENLTGRQLRDVLVRFGREQARGSEAALFYFAGHGAAVDDVNYLIPIDARAVDANLDSVKADGVKLEEVIRALDSARGTKIVMLDACRTRPVPGRPRQAGGAGGLAPVSAPDDYVIAFAADANQPAIDGQEGQVNGYFAQGVLEGFRGERLNLHSVLSVASKKVKELSNERQRPKTYGANDVQEDFWFARGNVAQAAPAPQEAAPVERPAQLPAASPPRPLAAPRTVVDSFVAPACGAAVTAVSGGATMPLAGPNVLLNPSNGDCLIGAPGQGLVVEVRLCPEAAGGVSRFDVRRGSQSVEGKNTKSRPDVAVYAAGAGDSAFRPIGSAKSFGDVKVSAGGIVTNIERLRIQIPGDRRYQERLCSIDVR